NAQGEIARELRLDADVGLLHHRVLQAVIDDVDAAGAGARQDKAGEGVARGRRERRKVARLIEEEEVAGAHLNRQSPSIEATFERLNLQRDAVVVDAIAAVQAQAPTGRPVEAEARAEVVLVAVAGAGQKREDQ